MKNIKDIASGGKYVPWETLAGSIDDNFTELNNGKLDKGSVMQSTGTSTTAVMSQKAVTDAIAAKGNNINVVQATGASTTDVMSQKAVTDAITSASRNTLNINYFNCYTASADADKAVTQIGLLSVDTHVRFLIKMQNANTASSVNLKINNGSTPISYPLYYNGTQAGSSNTWMAGAVLDIYYDGTNFQATDFISQGGSGGSDKVVHVWCTGDFYLADLDPVLAEEGKNMTIIEDILGLKPTQLYDYALGSTVIIHDTPSAQTESSTKFGCVVLNYSLCDLGGKGTVEENPSITNSDYIELTYTIGSKVYNYKLWFDKAENIYTGITDAHITDLGAGLLMTQGLISLASSDSITKELVESCLGSSDWRYLKSAVKDKAILDISKGGGMEMYSILTCALYVASEDKGTIAFSGVLNYLGMTVSFYIGLVFENGIFSSGEVSYSNLIDEAPQDGKSYIRKNGNWVEYTELKQEKICYYKTTKNDAVESEYYNTSKFPGDILGGTSSGDFQIVRFTVAPGKAHTGPSFMLFDGDYNYYAKWDAFGIYPSSDDYFSSGSGYVPKANVAFPKAASTEQVVYVGSTNKFQQISW